MENKFLKANPVNDDLSINYVEVNNMMKTLSRAVATREEYFDWVKDWKIQHNGLVTAIKHLHSVKTVAKFDEGNGDKASSIQVTKLKLRPFARELYHMRAENKLLFKSGAFNKETEAA
jgi:hypothetical protein